MEKQTGRKIKVLQFDTVGEYKRDQFLQFDQNNGIVFSSQFENKLGWLKS